MLFHEIYGSYFLAVTKILGQSVNGNLTGNMLRRIVKEQAFAESVLSIPDALEGGAWRLLDEYYETPLQNPPGMPMTLLQKRWLKALLLDPRIQLFAPDMTGLEDVKPLFTPDMFVYFDRYGDGDPFGDASYVAHFQTILWALKEKKRLEIQYLGKHGTARRFSCLPDRLEYSAKDDKFRLVCAEAVGMINLARIEKCRVEEEERHPCETKLRGAGQAAPGTQEAEARTLEAQALEVQTLEGQAGAGKTDEKSSLTFELTDERGALERVMLHFSHLEKETKRLDDRTYRVILYYDKSDETEILIRMLSFGAKVQVLEPEAFIGKIRERLVRQFSLQRAE